MKYSTSNMMALDIYLSSLSDEEHYELSSKINFDIKSTPLLSWDIFSHEKSLQLTELQVKQDITSVKALACKFNWDNDIDTLFNEADYEAIIVTDLSQKILWVNKGFSKMTGYSKSDALKNTPRFLQGQKTSEEKRATIRKKLSTSLPFKEVIINHRKDGTPYKCEVRIFPLHSGENKTHYIALERQVS